MGSRPLKYAPGSVDALLHELCVDLGFCLPPDANARIKDNPPDTIDSFVDAVLIGEGMDPHGGPKRVRKAIEERVAKYFKESGDPKWLDSN